MYVLFTASVQSTKISQLVYPGHSIKEAMKKRTNSNLVHLFADLEDSVIPARKKPLPKYGQSHSSKQQQYQCLCHPRFKFHQKEKRKKRKRKNKPNRVRLPEASTDVYIIRRLGQWSVPVVGQCRWIYLTK